MGLIYAPLVLAIVSGVISLHADNEKNVTGYLNEDVILPCNCSKRDFNSFKWQLKYNTTHNKLIFNLKLDNGTGYFGGYKSRVEASHENNNCSIRLKNLSLDDSRTYMCIFNSNGYKNYLVNLDVIQRPAAVMSPDQRVINPNEAPQVSSQKSRQYLTIFPVMVLLLVVGCLWNFYLKQRRNLTPVPSEDV